MSIPLAYIFITLDDVEYGKLDNGFNPLELFILSSSRAPLNLIGSAKIEWLKLSSAWRVWNAFSDFLNIIIIVGTVNFIDLLLC